MNPVYQSMKEMDKAQVELYKAICKQFDTELMHSYLLYTEALQRFMMVTEPVLGKYREPIEIINSDDLFS